MRKIVLTDANPTVVLTSTGAVRVPTVDGPQGRYVAPDAGRLAAVRAGLVSRSFVSID